MSPPEVSSSDSCDAVWLRFLLTVELDRCNFVAMRFLLRFTMKNSQQERSASRLLRFVQFELDRAINHGVWLHAALLDHHGEASGPIRSDQRQGNEVKKNERPNVASKSQNGTAGITACTTREHP